MGYGWTDPWRDQLRNIPSFIAARRDQGKEGVKNNEKVRHWTLPCVLSCSTFRLKWYDDNGAAGSRGADVVVVHSTTHGTLQQQMSRK